jgi:hypothetical protein
MLLAGGAPLWGRKPANIVKIGLEGGLFQE